MFDNLIAHGRVIASTVVAETKAVLVNLRLFESVETVPDTEAECAPDEAFFGTLGIVSRPDPPDAGGYAEVMAVRSGEGAQPFASRDLRINKRTNVKEGEIAVAQYGGGFVSVAWNKDRQGSTIVLLAPKLTSDLETIEKSHAIQLDSQSAKPAISIIHSDGHCLLLTHQKKAILKSANGKHYVEVSDSGINLCGTSKLVGGIVAGNSVSAQPVALFPATAAAMTAMASAFTALALVPEIIATPAAAACTAAAAACTAAAVPATGGSVTLKASPI